MNERDAKWKVKQARLQDRNRDAWHGIRDEDEDGENDGIVKVQGHGVGQADGGAGAGGEDEGEESEEGGWDLVASHQAGNGKLGGQLGNLVGQCVLITNLLYIITDKLYTHTYILR